jgi:predicted  nucleic acid-binding Zn-ribbon protein
VEDLIPVLTRFHREIVAPDIERIVAASEQRLRDEMQTLFDNLASELKDLRELYTMLSLAVKRIEERLERIEQRVDTMALRSELLELKARVTGLQDQVRALESRLEN